MAYDQYSAYEAPRRQYGAPPQQRQPQQTRQPPTAQAYDNFDPYAQDAGNPYADDVDPGYGQGYAQQPAYSQNAYQDRPKTSQSSRGNVYPQQSQQRSYSHDQYPQQGQQRSYSQEQYSQQQQQPQRTYTHDPYTQAPQQRSQAQPQYSQRDYARNDGGDYTQQSRSNDYSKQSNGYPQQPQSRPPQERAAYSQGQPPARHNGYARDQCRGQQQQAPARSQRDYDRGYAQEAAGEYTQSNGHSQRPEPARRQYGQEQQNGYSQGQVNGYGQARQERQQDHRQPDYSYQDYTSQAHGYDREQPQYNDERRYDPRYQQRRNDQAQPAYTARGDSQAFTSPTSRPNDPGTSRPHAQSLQSTSSVQSNAPKKLSMDEWKAQEKARMHNDARKPETIAQDNAFPTFPTKKAESVRGQSAMSMRSDDRPSTAHSSHPDGRPTLTRNHSSQPDLTDSARPSLDNQPRVSSPLQRSHTPPKDVLSPVRSRGPTINTADVPRSHTEQQPSTPGQGRPATSDSRYARKPAEQPLSPLGKFAQSVQDDSRTVSKQSHQVQPSTTSDIYSSYHDTTKQPMTREEEIEAEMPDFDSAAPSQTTRRPKQDADQHLETRSVSAAPNFDFGFTQPKSYAQQLDKPVQPYANENDGRRSMDDTRQGQRTMVNGRPPPQRFYNEGSSRPELERNMTAATDPGPQRMGSVPPGPSRMGSVPPNADALPAHPTPLRSGNMNGSRPVSSRPIPVRNYGTPAPAQNQPPAPVRNYGEPAQSQPAARVPSAEVPQRDEPPITMGELNRMRAQADANPQSMSQSLEFAKKLVEAAKVLSNEGGRADAKTTAKNRERFLMEAYKRVKKLSTGGYPPAQFYLADCYGQGMLGLEVDPKEAFKLYQAAAKAGHATAAYRTAVCCEIGSDEGGGTSKDLPRAVQWYRRAAALGETGAMFKVGMISLKGLLGQPKHLGEAVIWLKRAAERADRENPHALHELAQLYETANSTPELRQKIIPDDAYSLSMYKQAADLGSKYAQFRLGQCYEYGQLGLPIDHRSSIAWYSKAASQGEHQAELALSGWYLTGAPGILQQSDVEAYLWARKAAQAEPVLAKALFAMAYFLETGIGCPVNIDEAKRWYSRAASYKHPKALERLEAIKRGAKGGYKAMPVNARGKLSRRDQKKDEEECVVM